MLKSINQIFLSAIFTMSLSSFSGLALGADSEAKPFDALAMVGEYQRKIEALKVKPIAGHVGGVETGTNQNQHVVDAVSECANQVTEKITACAQKFKTQMSMAAEKMVIANSLLSRQKGDERIANGMIEKASSKLSAVQLAGQLSTTIDDANSVLLVARGACIISRGDGEGASSGGENQSPFTKCSPSKIIGSDTSTNEGRAAVVKMGALGLEALGKVDSQITIQVAAQLESKASATAARDSLLTMGVVGAGAVGAIAMIKSNRNDNKKDAAQKKATADYKNGFIVNADGDRMSCLTEDTYGAMECQQVLLDYCSNSTNSGKAGCGAFNNLYCSGAEASQTYCLANTAKTYCKSSGATSNDSPSCKWIKSRPTTCLKKPDSMDCMSTLTPAQLDSSCVSYPNDPLCQAYNAGKVVTQPDATTTDEQTQAGGGGSLDSILNGSNTSASVSDVNLFGKNTALVKELCDRGSIVNCK